MARSFLATFLLAVLVACTDPENGPLRMAEPGYQELLEAELHKNGLAYRAVYGEGIYYDARLERQVDALVKKVVQDDLPSSRSTSFADTDMTIEFKKRLGAAEIRYETKTRHGGTWVVWDLEHSAQGRAIADKLTDDLIRATERERNEKKSGATN